MDDSATLTSQEMDQIMCRGLSDDHFVFKGEKIPYQPLTIKHSKMWNKIFPNVVNSLATTLCEVESEILADKNGQLITDENGVARKRIKGFNEFSYSDWAFMGASILDQADLLPELVFILLQDAGTAMTREEFDNVRVPTEELQQIVLNYCKTAGALERKAYDFFTTVLPQLTKEISLGMEKMQNGENALNTALSKPLPEPMGTKSKKSTNK